MSENLEIFIDVSDTEKDTILSFPSSPFDKSSITLLSNGTIKFFKNNLQLNQVMTYKNYVIKFTDQYHLAKHEFLLFKLSFAIASRPIWATSNVDFEYDYCKPIGL